MTARLDAPQGSANARREAPRRRDDRSQGDRSDSVADAPSSRPIVVLGDTREATMLASQLGGAVQAAVDLDAATIDALSAGALAIDARHPYAAPIDFGGAVEDGRVVRLMRPPWPRRDGDDWRDAADAAAARGALSPEWRTVLLTLGRDALGPFEGDPGRLYLVRARGADGARLPLLRYRVLTAAGPYTEEAETALMRAAGVDAVVTRNDGSAGAYPKIAAARVLGLPVIMTARPSPGSAPQVDTVAGAAAWAVRAGMHGTALNATALNATALNGTD